MSWGSIASGGHIDLARVGFGISDEIGNGLGREGRIDHYDKRRTDNACDRRNIANEIEIEVVIERGINCVRRSAIKERVAIGQRFHDALSSDISASARPI